MTVFWRENANGLDLAVRLTPRSSRDMVDGAASSADGSSYLKARVRAVPEKGKANAALEKLLAKWLDVPVSQVSVISGATSRSKTVRITGEISRPLARIKGLMTEE